MKVLIFSDLHLHNWNYGSTLIDGMNSRLLDQANVLDKIAMHCTTNEIDHVVFCGDLFHTHGKIDAAVLKVAYEGITKIVSTPIKSIRFLVGNHDTSSKNQQVHSLHWLEAFKKATVINSPTRAGDFGYLPFTESIETIKKFFDSAPPVCFLHQGLAGVPMGSGFLLNEILSTDMIPSQVSKVFTGHYHQHTRATEKATVIGSTLQLTWADEGDTRGFLVYDTDSGSFFQVDSMAPKFVTVHKHSRGIDIFDNFVRLVDIECGLKDMRVQFMEAGARSVEFVQNKAEDASLKPLITCKEFHLPSIINEYERQKEVTPECSAIGKELMK
jgi:DNA repair exonuclease SbcCD nuclease subunit